MFSDKNKEEEAMVELTREKLEKINDLVGNHGWAKPVLDDLEIPFEQRLELVDFTYNQLRSIAAGENGESREDVEIAKARVRELLLGFIERDVYDSGCLIDFFHATNSQNFFYLNDRDEQCIYRKDITSEIKKIAYAKWLVLCWEEIDEFTDYKLANHRYVYLKRWVGRFTFGKMRLRKLAYAKWEEIVRTSIGSVETLTEVRDLYLYNLDLKSLRQTILEKWEEIVLGELSKIATLEQFKTLYGLSPENSQARDGCIITSVYKKKDFGVKLA